MYGVMPKRKDRHAAQHAAAEQIEVAEESTGSVAHEELLELVGVDPGRGDVGAYAVHSEQTQREQDAFPEIRYPKDVGERFKKLRHRLPWLPL